MSRSTRWLLAAGIAAAPLFLALWAVQAFTRDGFRPTFHPLSLLSLGEGGGVQIANFVIVGLLVAACGLGLRRVFRGRLGAWGAALVAVMGAGLIVAGVFVTDPGAGFPAGAPDGAPVMTVTGAVHEVGFVLTQAAFLAAAVVFAVLLARRGHRVEAAICLAAAAAAVVVVIVGDPAVLALRMLISAGIELALIGFLGAVGLSRSAGATRRRALAMAGTR